MICLGKTVIFPVTKRSAAISLNRLDQKTFSILLKDNLELKIIFLSKKKQNMKLKSSGLKVN